MKLPKYSHVAMSYILVIYKAISIILASLAQWLQTEGSLFWF